MKHYLILFLLLLSSVSVAFAYDAKVKYLYYNLNEETKTATVTYKKFDYNYRTTSYAGAIEVPSKIKVNKVEYTVKHIGDSAFFGCNEIVEITMPSTITTIGKSAFEGCICFYFNYPDSLVSIGERAFAYSSFYRDSRFPASLTEIGNEAFLNSKITAVYMPENMKHIGYGAFENCEELMGVSTTSLESWCNIDFETIYSNPLACAHNLLINSTQILTDIEIPDGVTAIRPNAFAGADITSVNIPASVTSIGSFAFYQCMSLEKVKIPSSVNIIDDNAFSYCTQLKHVRIKNPNIKIGENNFEDFHGKLIIEDADTYSDQCLPPVITYTDGQLNIASPTTGAVCQYMIQQEDIDNDGDLTELNIYAIAIADGLDNSEVVKVNLLDLMRKQ